MKILYFDCGMGAAGDMLCACLLDLLEAPESFVEEFNALGIPGLELKHYKAKSCSISGSKVKMIINGEVEESGAGGAHRHEHARSFADVMDIIDCLHVSDNVKSNARAVYKSIAGAEAKVHGESSLSQVHFHELGSMDAVADVVCFCVLIERIAPDKIISTPVNVGSGYFRCAHGVLPVPAPATAELLKGIPSYGGKEQSELCTPTGAALLRHFVDSFGPLPLMSTESVGYGIGTKVFERGNFLRALLGTGETGSELVNEIRCNLDDMSGEGIAFAMDALLKAGSLDVYTVPIGMKKSRPAVMLCCICDRADTERLSALMLKHTTSLGVRISELKRSVLPRKIETVETAYGPVRIKRVPDSFKPEYDDIAGIAKENGLSLAEVSEIVRRAVEKEAEYAES